MAIRVYCDECDYEFPARNEHAGRRVRCPECGAPAQVPNPGRSRGRTRNQPAARGAAPRRASSGPSRSRRAEPESSPITKPAIIGGAVVGVLLVVLLVVKLSSSDDDNPGDEIAAANNNALNNNNGLNPAPNLAPDPAPAPQPATLPPPRPLNPGLNPANPAKPIGTNPLPLGTTPPGNTVVNVTPQNPNPGPKTPPKVDTTSSNTASKPSERVKLSLADVNEVIEPSVVRIEVQGIGDAGTGSGYVVSKDGLVVTNYHVIANGAKAYVVWSNKKRAPVTGIVALDHTRDIAILKIDSPADQLVPLKIAKELPRKGESVVALGAPLGFEFTLTQGIVSAIRSKNEMQNSHGLNVSGTWLQTTAPISPGNSGGPLVNLYGELVGMNTMTLTIGQNLNFAISAQDVSMMLAKPRPSQLIALTPQNVPERSKTRREYDPNDGKIIDATDTAEGRQFLSALKQVVLLKVELGFADVTGRVKRLLEGEAERALQSVKVKLVRRARQIEDPAIMIMALNFDDAEIGTAGTQAMKLKVMILWHGLDKQGKERLYMIYNKESSIGTFSASALSRGIIPRTVQTNVSRHFRSFVSAFRRAQRENGG